MRKIASAFLLLILSIFYISCAPNADYDGDLLFGVNQNVGSGNGNDGGPIITGKVLSKITTKDDDGNDLIVNFLYTNTQLTGITTSDNSFTYTISYVGNSISKIVKKSSEGGQSLINTYNLVYQNSILTSIDEFDNLGGGQKNTGTIVYSYDNTGKLSNAHQTIYNDGSGTNIEVSSADFKPTFTGNNVSNYVLKTVIGAGNSGLPSPSITTNFTANALDTKTNPYHTLPQVFNLADIFGLGINGLSANNFTKATVTRTTSITIPPSTTPIDNTTTQTETPTYTYDFNGYTSTQTIGGNTIQFDYIKF